MDQYLEKMDIAGVERSLLIAVRAGDIRVPESFEIPYSRDRIAGDSMSKPF